MAEVRWRWWRLWVQGWDLGGGPRRGWIRLVSIGRWSLFWDMKK